MTVSQLPSSSLSTSAADTSGSAAGSGGGIATGSGTTSGETSPSVDLDEIAGTFTCLDDERYPNDRAPSFTLDKDGKFVFHINLGDGRLGVLSGSYTLSGSLTMLVKKRDSDDYLGQDLDTFTFTMTDEDNFVYGSSPLGLTYNGNVFVREGAKKAKPKTASSAATAGSAASGSSSASTRTAASK